ncbi:MAG: hypothetical protein OXM61_18620 [Candidatus Poribacteria bacterium]|nr:hypothetical protein [Candidatus Poribacteria bacterium]
MCPKQLTRIGIFYLEEAILNVLLEAKQKGNDLRLVDIEKKIGTYRAWEREPNWLPRTVLYKLEEEKRVQVRLSEKGRAIGFQLTDAEYNKRQNTEG